ncbi:DUF6629 family protein [Streptomyces qinzhouensis]|uniref:Integral membrane protein n=1 Tax=Streptomyces qinzhouensis TaxID=2599401 RepID=A0A5B8J2L0_9ACTN|nr:DUF6629 family protein [Streptomyces qinzhouensis]QDY75447.1 hypothetical protein FQU76_01785 [Streptomyces qinzhouensis]
MCWSATADLVAGIAIGAVGAVCVVRVRRARDLPLAALPLLLGAHQIIEAALWHGGGGSGPATLAWAVIALPVLPLYVPLAVASGTWPPRGRAGGLRLAVPLAAGAATAAVLAHRLTEATVTAEIHGRTVGYAVGLPAPAAVLAGYLLATVGALLLSGDRTLRLLGAVTGAGAVICALLWRTAFISTWCALAAVASLLILRWVRRDPGPGVRFASAAGARKAGDDTPHRAPPERQQKGPP